MVIFQLMGSLLLLTVPLDTNWWVWPKESVRQIGSGLVILHFAKVRKVLFNVFQLTVKMLFLSICNRLSLIQTLDYPDSGLDYNFAQLEQIF